MRNLLRRPWLVLPAVAVVPLVLVTSGMTASAQSATGTAARLAAIKHVWVIELENEGYAQSFGNPSADPYLATTLPSMGALLKNYYATGHDSADNYISQISGQAPDTATQNDCSVWTPFVATSAALTKYDQLVGNGCVYPASVKTLRRTATRTSSPSGRC